MKNLKRCSKSALWFTALFTAVVVSGCGGGHWDGQSSPANGGDPDNEPVIPLTIINSDPGDDATGVSVGSSVSATFNAAMNESTINDTTFTLTGPNSTEVEGVVSYSPANTTATFAPASDLGFSTVYTAVITTDVLNAEGVGFEADYSWSFTTYGASVAVIKSNPLDANVDVCVNKAITATFDRPMDEATLESPASSFTLVETLNNNDIDGVVTLDLAGTTATFTPALSLLENMEYTAVVSTAAADLNGSSLQEEMVWSFTTNDSVCQAPVSLGATEPYGVLSNTGITLGGGPDSTTGPRVDGDVGISPAGACVGCDLSTVSGLIHNGETASAAMIALESAYNDALNRSTNLCTLIDSGVLATNPSASCGGNADGVFPAGLYWSGTSIAIPAGGTITLDAKNDPDAVFIFQSASTIDTIGGDTHVILANGAQSKNVFWVAGSSASIGGVDSDFAGTILAAMAITVNTGTGMDGRALARGAEVTVQDGALITVPAK